MNKNIKRFVLTLLAAALLITAFAGCNMTPVATSENLLGTWNAGGFSTWTFTSVGFSNDGSPAGDGGWDYSGYVLKAVEGSFNNAADSPAGTNCGYLVIRVTEHSNDSNQLGTCTIIRWQNKTVAGGVTTVEYAEAYPAGWETVAEAEASATTADNFAYGFSTMTKLD
jgi:hypothetical protein